jgi:hypothetical protein
MLFQERGKRLEVRFEEINTKQESKLFQSRNLLCYTRECVKREEKEILQRQHTLFIYNSSATLESFLML